MESHEDENKTKNMILFPGFTLYRYSVNNISEVDNVKEDDKNYSLSVVSTSLNTEHELELRNFVQRKLTRGAVHSRAGNIASIEFSVESEKEDAGQALCYYTMLKQHQDESHTAESIFCSNSFVLCEIASPDTVLDLFRPELDKLSKKIMVLLDEDVSSLEDVVRPSLESWYTDVTGYLHRVVDQLKDNIQYLIHAALSDAKLDVVCADSQLKSDIIRFFDCCSLSDLLTRSRSDREGSSDSQSDTSAVLVNVTSDVERPRVVMTVAFDKCIVKNGETSDFCKEWGDTLVHGDSNNPVFIRQVIENYKLKTIKDMNSLKRHLRNAENDYYALYRCLVFLRNSGYSSILLQHAEKDAEAHHTKEAQEILQVLHQQIEDERKDTPQSEEHDR